MARVLTIAGSDSGGGAGIQADIKTLTSLQVYASTVITSVTSQNTLGVDGIQHLPVEFVEKQMRAVLSDIGTDATKAGMLGPPETIVRIARVLKEFPEATRRLVVDPVMVSTSGSRLLDEDAVKVLKDDLLPLSYMVTPNVPEAEILLGQAPGSIRSLDDMRQAAKQLATTGSQYVLVKGGHVPMEKQGSRIVIDVLLDTRSGEIHELLHPYVDTQDTHGTGCTLSSAIAAHLARGSQAYDAVLSATDYIQQALQHSLGHIGKGHGPLNHFHALSTASFTPNNFVSALKDALPSGLWEAFLNHPFVRQMAEGTLKRECFEYYIKQDYLYLQHYARCAALAAYKAPDIEVSARNARIVIHIHEEMQLHLKYCEQWGISKQDILNTPESVYNIAYTRYVLDKGATGDQLDLQVALAPCLLGYGEIGVMLYNDPRTKREANPYWPWICNYNDASFQDAVKIGKGNYPLYRSMQDIRAGNASRIKLLGYGIEHAINRVTLAQKGKSSPLARKKMHTFQNIDYTLYLVTDSGLVPEGHDFYEHIEEALKGGVTVVQLREKSLDTRPLTEKANKVKALCRKYNVPFIINDRVDVALAVDADGVHVGQDDMPVQEARRILGDQKIIGVSVSNPAEAVAAVKSGADYMGIGPVFDTQTKKLTKPTLEYEGLEAILRSVSSVSIPAVAIGGLNTQIGDLMRRFNKPGMRLWGCAVVSAIMADKDPRKAAKELKELAVAGREGSMDWYTPDNNDDSGADHLGEDVRNALAQVRTQGPMVHHITNYVVINDNANATLALGASPIMSTNPEEVEDLAKVNGAMVLNMGTLNNLETMIAAARANFHHGNPVVFDPVGGGATTFRKQVFRRFLNECKLTIIKGNAGEILSINGRGGQSRGVDSVGSVTPKEAIVAVKEVANKERCIVAMTGKVDYVSDGTRVVEIENGHELLASITGSGCMATTVIACFAAANRHDYLMATAAGIITLNVAAERAAARPDVKGPGTFRAALIDELYVLSKNPASVVSQVKARFV